MTEQPNAKLRETIADLVSDADVSCADLIADEIMSLARADLSPKVKPLEWVKLSDSLFEAKAEPFGTYTVECFDDSDGPYWQWSWMYQDVDTTDFFGDEGRQKAMDAAQRYQDKRIRSAIATAPVTPQQAAEVLLGDDVLIARMAKAMHDGPLMADEYEYRADTKAGGWCIDMARSALKAIAEDG